METGTWLVSRGIQPQGGNIYTCLSHLPSSTTDLHDWMLSPGSAQGWLNYRRLKSKCVISVLLALYHLSTPTVILGWPFHWASIPPSSFQILTTWCQEGKKHGTATHNRDVSLQMPRHLQSSLSHSGTKGWRGLNEMMQSDRDGWI